MLVVRAAVNPNTDEKYEYFDTHSMHKRMIKFINTFNWFWGHDIYTPNFNIGPYAVLINCVFIHEIIATFIEMRSNISFKDYTQALQTISTVIFPIQARYNQKKYQTKLKSIYPLIAELSQIHNASVFPKKFK